MTFLPIVERELRVAARRGGTYWSRTLAAFLAVALGTYVFLVGRQGPASQLGFILFAAFAWLAFLSCILTGVRQTADCISEERREGTLGLLFLTDLKGYDVALGKLVASSVASVYALLAIVPVIAISLMFGGITATQLGRVVLVLLATMFFSLALGMFVSNWFHNGRRASAVTFLLLFLVTVGPWMAMGLWASTGVNPTRLASAERFLMISPAYLHGVAVFTGMPGLPARPFWVGWLLLLAEGVALMGLVSVVLPRVWRDRPSAPWRMRWRAWLQRWTQGGPAFRRDFRARLLDANPFFWLAARDRLKPAYVWAFLASNAVGWLAFALAFPGLWGDLGFGRYITISLIVHGGLRVWIAYTAAQRLAEDHHSGALELILSTPLSTAEIFAGQLRALYRQFGGAIAVLLVTDIVFCFLALEESSSDRDMTLLFFGAHMAMFVGDTYALAWQGMWSAVTARHPNAAAMVPLARVFALPWAVLIAFGSAFQLLGLDRRWGWDLSDKAVLGVWFGVGLITDVLLILHARMKLRTQFRLIATQRFTTRSWWRRWLGAH